MNKRKTEELRYDSRAKNRLYFNSFNSVNKLNKASKVPYIFYEHCILERISKHSSVLEIGSGMGENTEFLLDSGAKVCATDISKYSLNVIQRRFDSNKLTTKVSDMEKLPFDEDSFDLVCCAGSLSYGDNLKVMNEIYRVLKKNGVFVAIDSLNNNPIYRLNRYIHYLKGERSLDTIKRTPDLKLLQKYKLKFNRTQLFFFGSITYLTPILNSIFSEEVVVKISNFIDKIFCIKRSAFKFILIVEK
jgi:ubiquinone/menaquinone biosynthesis C-methylase UbiE